jgi:hypothetical protein
MEFMLLFLAREGPPGAEPEGMAEMTRFAQALARGGKLRRGAPLAAESDRAHVRVREGKALVSDGPFTETKEAVGGFWIVDVADREEAIAVAGRCPHARHGVVEVHPLAARHVFADSGRGTPFLLAFHMEPGLSDPDGSKLREMIAFGEDLARQGKLLETTPLADDPPAARIMVRRGKTLVTDGPFAEAKEGIGGYSLVRVSDRAAAIELAKIYPHARWGPVEVREILFFDRIGSEP